MQVIAWDLTGEYVIIYNEEELRQLLGKTGTVLSGEINHKPFYYQMKIWGWSLVHGDDLHRPWTPKEAKVWKHHTLHRGSPDEEVKAVKRLQRGVYRRRAAAPAPESDAASTVSLYGSELEPESATGPDPISSPALDTLLTAGRDGGTVSSCSNWCNTAIPPNPFPSTATPYTPLQLPPMPAPLSMPERLGYPDPCIYQAATNILRFQAQPAPVTREEELITIRVTRAQARLLHVLLQWHLDLGAGLQGTPAAELSEGYERSG